MPFRGRLQFEVEPTEKTSIVLTAPLVYFDRHGRKFTVPKGFRCDLASVPRWVRSVATPWNQSARPGVWHDCAYRWFETWNISRRDADSIYRDALKEEGVAGWRAWLQKTAVNIGARGPWERWRQTSVKRKGPKPPRWVSTRWAPGAPLDESDSAPSP